MRLGWWSELTKLERRTYLAAFGGLALDSMDTTIYALVTPTLIAVLGITKPEAGLLATVNLLGAAIGGWIGGILADRFGRVRVLQLTILVVALSTFAAAFANGFAYLAVARAIQGMGYGAEAAVGAVLVMEVVQARLRGRVASSIQSGYAVGNAISVALLPVLFGWLSPDLAWRCFFAIGLLPAALVFFVRRFVPESALFVEQAETPSAHEKPFWTIFTGPHLFKTIVGTLFTTGTLGAAYVLITWLPTYLVTVKHLEVGRTASYLALNIFGSFCGPIAFGYLADRLGRRKCFMLFLVLQALNLLVYTQGGIGAATTFALGFFLGAFQGGLASGLMPTFSELFPTAIRANGAGFALSAGRGLGSILPGMTGILAAHWPLGDAMVVCALSAYTLAFAMALILPEAAGVDLRAVDDGPAPEFAGQHDGAIRSKQPA
jgi:MFS family permease